MRFLIFSLRTHNGKTILNYNLTGHLTDFDNHNSNILEINLPTGTIHLNKWQYLNKMKVYEDPKNPKCFFIVAMYKKMNPDFVFNFLMEYAINKIEKTVDELSVRMQTLHTVKEKLQREIAA